MGYIKDIRKYVGHAPLMCCAVGAIIINKKNQILLQKVEIYIIDLYFFCNLFKKHVTILVENDKEKI